MDVIITLDIAKQENVSNHELNTLSVAADILIQRENHEDLSFKMIEKFCYNLAIFGGVFLGLGIGLSIRGGCTLDGIEVLALYTGRWISFTTSEIIFGLNIVILLLQRAVF